MFRQLTEFILPRIIGVMVHKRERLTKLERVAHDAFIAKLDIKKRTTKESIIVAMVGLIGSGKSSVAQELARHVSATIIEGDAIRIELRRQGERYERSRAIAERAALEVVNQGGNVILDSDFVDEKKRASARQIARKAGIRILFVRAYCDIDVAVGRILNATYRNEIDDFFGGAKSIWKWKDQSSGAVVKIREMWRRTPHHYRWVNRGGGVWVLKKLPFALFAEIDTADSDSWKRQVEKCSNTILKM